MLSHFFKKLFVAVISLSLNTWAGQTLSSIKKSDKTAEKSKNIPINTEKKGILVFEQELDTLSDISNPFFLESESDKTAEKSKSAFITIEKENILAVQKEIPTFNDIPYEIFLYSIFPFFYKDMNHIGGVKYLMDLICVNRKFNSLVKKYTQENFINIPKVFKNPEKVFAPIDPFIPYLSENSFQLKHYIQFLRNADITASIIINTKEASHFNILSEHKAQLSSEENSFSIMLEVPDSKNYFYSNFINVESFLNNIKDFKFLEILSCSSQSMGDKGAKYIANILTKCDSLKILELANNKIGPEGAKALCDAILSTDHKGAKKLENLNLSINKIDDYVVLTNGVVYRIPYKGTQYIAKIIKESRFLEIINLYDNQIGNEGVKYLAEALKENKTLKKLDFTLNEIGDEGAMQIGEAIINNTSLQNLILDDTWIGDEGALVLVRSFIESKKLGVSSLNYISYESEYITIEGEEKIQKLLEQNPF
jgi:hypothetical protein